MKEILKITSYFLIPELFVCINYEKAERNNNFKLGSKKLKKKKKIANLFLFFEFLFPKFFGCDDLDNDSQELLTKPFLLLDFVQCKTER